MSIGPSLPPHLQHLLSNPDASDDHNADEDVLVLHESDASLSDVDCGDTDPVEPPLRANRTRKVSEENSFGPALPPGLKASAGSESELDEHSFGPALPPALRSNRNSRKTSDENPFGPALPTSLPTNDSSGNDSDEPLFGPALPPNLLANQNSVTPAQERSFGPSLPPGLTTNDGSGNDLDEPLFGPAIPLSLRANQNHSQERSFGPTLPPGLLAGPSRLSAIGPALPPGLQLSDVADNEEDSDDDVIGPLPLSDESRPSELESLRRQMEKRAMKMKRKLKGEDVDAGEPKRETWMLELPPDRASEFGLGPRQFRAKAKMALGDRTVWTDTPEERQKKQLAPSEADTSNLEDLQAKAIADRDVAMQKFTDKHNRRKQRKESLVEMHQKKLRKKQKKEEEKLKGKQKERRPFDRDVDLQANRFDEAQKKAVLKKAQLLDTRFSRGESKFL